jgi:hypothetical protein
MARLGRALVKAALGAMQAKAGRAEWRLEVLEVLQVQAEEWQELAELRELAEAGRRA